MIQWLQIMKIRKSEGLKKCKERPQSQSRLQTWGSVLGNHAFGDPSTWCKQPSTQSTSSSGPLEALYKHPAARRAYYTRWSCRNASHMDRAQPSRLSILAVLYTHFEQIWWHLQRVHWALLRLHIYRHKRRFLLHVRARTVQHGTSISKGDTEMDYCDA